MIVIRIAKTILLLIGFFTVCPLSSQKVTLTFVGDVMGHSPQINSARRDSGRYDYSECFRLIEPYFMSSEIAVANLEVTLAGTPYTGYPTFSSPDELVVALKNAGVNFLVTANNHSCDRRKKGVDRTIEIIDDLYFSHTGTFSDSADMTGKHPLLLSVYGIRLAFLNYTYGTNGIPVTKPNIVNHIDTVAMSCDIQMAKEMNADKIIVCIHWGDEYKTTPNRSQTGVAAFLQRSGVDIIIGSHPHVIQPMHLTQNEDSTRQIVVYSLGNFISNQRNPYTDGGAMIRIELSKQDSVTVIDNAEYLLTWVHIPVVDGRKHYMVLPASVYDKKGVPGHVPQGYSGMFKYLQLARQVMKNNTGIFEIEEEWDL
ncbi:MAG: CapA family protein [Cytophagaceae bacterium]|jgi:poly-gamma-glutamate synthesis protein (capsule biosynthesis protein)|nr:CapA family protein [Cytophagaceae bacterium]